MLFRSNLLVGDSNPSGTVDPTQASLRVDVTAGGVIEKTTGDNLTVLGQSLQIDGSAAADTTQHSRIVLGNTLAATGLAASTTLTSPVTGNFSIEATKADATVGKRTALTLSNGGQAIGNQTGSGQMTVTADAADTATPANNGSVTVTGGGLIAKTAQFGATGNLAVQGGNILVTGAGSLILDGASPANPTQAAGTRSGGSLTVYAAGADPTASGYALTVSSNGQITANTTLDATLYTVAGASVGIASQGQVTGSNTGATSVGTNGSVTSKQISVTTGGIIQETAGTGLTVQGGSLLVDGTGSLVTAGTGVTGAFNVYASVLDTASASGYALTVSNSGQLLAQNTGSLNAYAATGSSVSVASNALINGANSGAMNLGTNGSVISKQVSVTTGGSVEKTGGGDLNVTAQTVLADSGGSIRYGASGAASEPAGAFTVTATSADAGPASALTIGATGGSAAQIAGYGNGNMAVLAGLGSISVAGGKIASANSGALQVGNVASGVNTTLVSVSAGGSINKTAGTDLAVKGQKILVDASTIQTSSSGQLTVEATAADPSSSSFALTVQNGGQISGGNAGSTAVLADLGTVAATAGGIIQATAGTGLSVQGGSLLVDGTGSLVTAGTGVTGAFNVYASGLDTASASGYALTVSNSGQILAKNNGNLNAYAATGSSVSVASLGTVNGANSGAMNLGTNGSVTSKQVSVTTGGIIQETAGTGLTVQGGSILVDGTGSLVTAGSGLDGAFNVYATGTDPAGGYALTISNLGQVLAKQTGDLNLYAAPGSSVLVTTQGRVSAANTGNLLVGDSNPSGTVDPTQASLRVDVTAGGVIEKTTGDNLTVLGQSLQIDGSAAADTTQHSRIVLGNTLAATGLAASTTLTSPVTGNFSIEATKADATVGTRTALVVSNGGQIIGNQTGSGQMTVTADAADTATPANNGSVTEIGRASCRERVCQYV